MGLALVRTSASPASGTTYQPNALLSDFFIVTLPVGSITIAPVINLGAGQFVAIKLIFPNGSVTLNWDPAYLGEQSALVSSGGYAMTYGWFYEGAAFQRVWTGAS